MIGISTSFFAFHGLGIYPAVERARELGFKTVELGAAHQLETDVFSTLKRIKDDFSDLEFTAHGFFPPQKQHFWFNPCEGLSPRNKKLLEDLFKAAEVVEAKLASIHVGALNELGYDPANLKNGMVWEINLGKLEKKKAMTNFRRTVSFALDLSKETGVAFAIENIPQVVVDPALLSLEDFQSFLAEFPGLNLLLDVGHAMIEGRLEELLQLKGRIKELHLHDSDGRKDHLPLGEGRLDLNQLKEIPHLKKLPLVLEYGGKTTEGQVMASKKLAEDFLSGIKSGQ